MSARGGREGGTDALNGKQLGVYPRAGFPGNAVETTERTDARHRGQLVQNQPLQPNRSLTCRFTRFARDGISVRLVRGCTSTNLLASLRSR